MRKAGRQKDSIWAEFEEVATHSQNKEIHAKCKVCGKELQGLVQRLRDHKKKCKEPQRDSDLEAETIEDPQPVTQTSATPSVLEVSASGVEKHIAPSFTSFPFKCSSSDSLVKDSDSPTTSITHTLKKNVSTSSHNTSILNNGVKTAKEEKEKIDEKVAMVYATNSFFKIVEHASFIDMVNVMRPGYKLPSRREIGGSLLGKVYGKECEKNVVDLEGKTVCMSLDGWTNVSSEPVICASITIHTSENTRSVYLVDTIDKSGHPHPSFFLIWLGNYLQQRPQVLEWRGFFLHLVLFLQSLEIG
ncbi:uncharacterized protein LOC126981494 isoform X2 [Eriocheir sinensis]|uniref:uncharacterized protein LOC126981494 isoform X1 n=1 Tax=Eriocheir sinensis TaxID=95602 RepID=UPI0021CAB535|nr:uncharacterized protein LOC126981494 isoform X1 [Eriocheir sinensis]XP_050688546.1 uncharacterized protein LOC126981494 isoform X2 [Eriocheir sinensis]